ncbi:hypothetical protein MASR2M8_22410 [Opitutaceae bacterium]
MIDASTGPVRPAPSVDNPSKQSQLHCVKPKPHKVEEPTAPYAAKPTAGKGSGTPHPPSGDAAFRKAADKIFAERKELLRKLAQ